MKIGTLPSIKFLGIGDINGPFLDNKGMEFDPQMMETETIFDVLNTSYDCDLHYCLYSIAGEDQWPRLKKTALKSIKEAGGTVVSKYIVMDWDTPKLEGSKDKTPLNDDLFSEFVDMVYGAEGELGNWCAIYTTRNGGRVIYQLVDPIPVEVMEEYVLGMMHSWLHDAGVQMDTACKDWTRLFRAPMVMRDGKASWEDEFFIVDTNEDRFLDISKLMRVPAELSTRETYDGDRSIPTSEDVHELMAFRSPTTRQFVQSAFFKTAKKYLKNTEVYKCVFGDEDMCPHGERNNTIGRYFGITTPIMMRKFKGLTPQHIFALFYDQLASLEPDAGTPCWLTHAWNYLLVIWEKETNKFNAEKLNEAARHSEALNIMDRMVKGMQKWCDDDGDIQSEDQETRYEFVRRHSFVTYNKFFYQLGPDGEYETFPVTKEQLVSRIRKTHMDGIIETRTENIQGKEIDVSSTVLQNEYSTPVEEIIMKPQLNARGIVEDLNGMHPKFVMPMYRRNPLLEPEYNEHVDEWLRYFFGTHITTGLDWIANALAFEDGPICALSIKGPKGIGKKILIEGLSECLEKPYFATGKDICGTFNEGLSKSPFLYINEGWPANKGDMATSDLFKSFTAGDSVQISQKYKPNMTIINPMRILLTANDHDLVYALSGGKDMSKDSREAAGERLYHADVNGDAGRYLQMLGGKEFTGKVGQRWIRDDAGGGSDHVVAKHFLWLYHHRDEPNKRQRLLVMGNQGTENHIMFDMLLQQTHPANCIKAILRMVEGRVTRMDAMHIESGNYKLFVTVAGLSEFMENIMEIRGVSLRSTELALKNISMSEEGVVKDNRKWIEIDCESVLQFAEQMGIKAEILRGIVKQQNKV